MARHQAPNVPFVEARHVGGPQKPTAIVLRLSSTTSDKGAALGVAQNLHSASSPILSFHYIVDNEMIYRGVPDEVATSGNLYRAINILMCAQPHEDVAMWQEATALPVLHRTADLVADMMLAYKIRPRYLREDAEASWYKHRWTRRGGLIVRIPGAWPYESFMNDVKAQLVIKDAGITIPQPRRLQ